MKASDEQCPWCGERLGDGWGDAGDRMSLDQLLEAHITECEVYIEEQGGEPE